MGLLQNLINGLSRLGYNGNRPPFNGETPGSTLHNTSSQNGIPPHPRNESILDEEDAANSSIWRSKIGDRYIDHLPQ